MILDLNKYKAMRKQIRAFVDTRPENTNIMAVNNLAIATHTPLVVAFHFLGEYKGYTEELRRTIASLTEYYNYEKIIPIQEEE